MSIIKPHPSVISQYALQWYLCISISASNAMNNTSNLSAKFIVSNKSYSERGKNKIYGFLILFREVKSIEVCHNWYFINSSHCNYSVWRSIEYSREESYFSYQYNSFHCLLQLFDTSITSAKSIKNKTLKCHFSMHSLIFKRTFLRFSRQYGHIHRSLFFPLDIITSIRCENPLIDLLNVCLHWQWLVWPEKSNFIHQLKSNFFSQSK